MHSNCMPECKVCVCVATSQVCVGVLLPTRCVCVCVLLLVKPTYAEWFRADKGEREGKHYFYLSDNFYMKIIWCKENKYFYENDFLSIRLIFLF